MQITNMKQVKENIGKRVKVKFDEVEGFIEGKLVKGSFVDCESDNIRLWSGYSIRFDKTGNDGCTWCSLSDICFDNEVFLEFETIEE